MQGTPRGGLIALMAKNSVAANLLMVFIMLAGVFLGILQLRQEVFPEFDLDIISVQVVYPGASPDEVEQGIVLAVEEEVRSLDGVKSVRSTASEGVGAIQVELLLGANPDKVLADVKNAVDRITSFPEEAEQPSVSLLTSRRQVIGMVISGDQSLRTLHNLAEKARVDLLAGGGVTVVELDGVPPLEVAVEISREDLERYDLSLDEVAQRIRLSSLELPAGGVETRRGQVLVKVDDRRRSGFAFADVVLRGTPGGGVLRLADIATIRDTYAETDQAAYLDGERAVRIDAYRVGSESPQQVADTVRAYAQTLQDAYPDGIRVTLLKDQSILLRERIDLLVRNGVQGLFLVLVVLYLFLNARLAFWVAVGIPISFLGAFALLPGFDITINMISLFGFIITLGLVVDDAIIVGENIFEKMEQGLAPMEAAIVGAREMSVPVTFAVLTTIVAFSPMFFVPGVTGKIFFILPGIVLAVLIFSLIESFLVLPAHLGHQSRLARFVQRRLRFIDAPSRWFSERLAAFTDRVYRPVLRGVLRGRYLVSGLAVALFAISVGVTASGMVPFSPFPRLEGNEVTAAAQLPFGAPIEATERVRAALEEGLAQAVEELDAPEAVVGVFSAVGRGPIAGGPVSTPTAGGSHLVTVELELVGSERRKVTAEQIAKAWERSTPLLPGLESLTFNANIGPGGEADVDVQLSHPDPEVLVTLAAQMADTLRGYSDLTGVKNSYAEGKPQLSYQILPRASTLGLTGSDVARQLRASFFGSEALREQRGRNEVKVMVRLPREQRETEFTLEELRVRTPTGGYVPLREIAEVRRGQSPTDIRREDGRRVVDVTAMLAEGVDSNQRVVRSLSEEVFPALREQHPALGLRFAGSQADLSEAISTLMRYYAVALVVIFALLAIPFRSYGQPLIIMLAIPMGYVGAVGGHVLLGYGMSMISLFGIVALSGVVVNDSLVLIDAANQRRRQDDFGAVDAILYAGARRLRPILLTSFTTFFGLMPLIFETSVQARFIIPMAISLGFGILFATFVILLLVPAGYLILEDIKQLSARFFGAILGPDEDVPPVAATEGSDRG
ncbi:MAG: efflux RND transporter permease subunit [Deltaproteobacteria bacterium]|nr:MAG: efflux RND transporter permease subunit [Deltaproteobacteria bacterium]